MEIRNKERKGKNKVFSLLIFPIISEKFQGGPLKEECPYKLFSFFSESQFIHLLLNLYYSVFFNYSHKLFII